MHPSDLHATEYNEWYAGYIALVPAVSIAEALALSIDRLKRQFADFDEARGGYAYAPGKWTIGQSLQHIVDTERIFAARALRIARGDTTPLPGFDQDAYAAAAPARGRSAGSLVEELQSLRRSNIMMFAHLTGEELGRVGQMSGSPASCRAIGYIMAGHVFHHVRLFGDRYGVGDN